MDLFTKPNAYRDLGNLANKNYGGAFYVSRFNNNKLKLFYHEGEDNTEHGIFAYFENFGGFMCNRARHTRKDTKWFIKK